MSKCKNSNLTMSVIGDMLRRFRQVGGNRRVCPACGKEVKLRNLPSSSNYLVVPAHNVPIDTE